MIGKAQVSDANLDRDRAVHVSTAQRAHSGYAYRRDQVDREFD
jgi:hypothetical protein